MKTLQQIERIFRGISRAFFFPASFLYYFRIGKENEYPTCCVLHFALDVAGGKDGRALRRGLIFRHTKRVYVPCGFHSGRHPHWQPYSGDRHQLTLF